MLNRPLDLLLGGLTLLTPAALHLFLAAIPAVKAEFELSDALAQLTFSVGVFGLAFSTLAYGALGDRLGRRPVLLAGITLFVLGSVVSGLATSFAGLLAGRLIQAVGAGCGVTLARAIAGDVYGAEGMVKSIAYLSLAFALGGLAAPGVGGLLVDRAGWRAIFAFASIAGLAVLIGTYLLVPDTGGHTPAGRGAPMAGGILKLLRHTRVCALVVHTGSTTGTFMTLATASSVLMKEVLDRPAAEFGLYFAMMPLGFISGSLISSRLANRAPVERMVLIGAGIGLAAVLVQASLLLSGRLTPLVLVVPGAFVTFGQGLSLPFAQAGAMATVPTLAATAAGIGVFVQNLMGAGVAQLYGLMADGTAIPLVKTTVAMSALSLASALAASLLARPKA
ncbi:MAG: MFS transporter [Hyphomicrobiaceae bacterium]|nr:MFS transporter [Hyphomicrobiaceae bacterium]